MSRYERGARLERRVKAELEQSGFICYRSAGSKGAADLIAMRDGETLLVQVKLGGTMERVERLRLLTEARLTGHKPVLAYTDPDPADGRRRRMVLMHLVGKGPRDLVEFTVMPS